MLSALLNDGSARRALANQRLHAPHLIDSEAANGLHRLVATRQVDASAAWAALDALSRLGMRRYPVFPFLDRIWELRDNLSSCDASYVALAELLDCNLVTGDARLSRAPGVRCAITVLPG